MDLEDNWQSLSQMRIRTCARDCQVGQEQTFSNTDPPDLALRGPQRPAVSTSPGWGLWSPIDSRLWPALLAATFLL